MGSNDATPTEPDAANETEGAQGAPAPRVDEPKSAATDPQAAPLEPAAPEATTARGEPAAPEATTAPEATASSEAPAAPVAESGPREAAASDEGTPRPAAAASDEGAPLPVAATTDEAVKADTTQPSDAASATAASTPDGAKSDGKKKKKRRRRKKKPAEADAKNKPATDRAPFHVGEDVFGKVTAVLDAAIMVDLSGKALGIFDRSEMEADDLVPGPGDRFLASVYNDGARTGFVVLTRKPLREEDAKPKVEQASKDGTLVNGLVTGAIKGGVEVNIEGLRAFAPASGMDLHPSEANFGSLVGQVLDFKVLEFKNNGRDVVVTRRPMLEKEAHERRKKALGLLEEGAVMQGVVRTVVEWGAFVALPEAENLEGLVHISEASHDVQAKIEDLFKPGDKVEIKITKIDERGKVWMSKKALVPDPWGEAKKKYAPGTRHKGKVTRVEPFGAFVSLESGIDGLIHISDLALKRLEHANEVVKEEEEVEVVVHHFDTRNRKLGLHPAPPPERADEKPQKVSRGATLDVEVVKGEQAGLRVRVLGATGRYQRGFIPAGHTGTARGTDLRKKFKIGTALRAKVLDVDPRRGEPKLSIRVMAEDEERQAHKDYRKKLQQESGFGTLGDLLNRALKK